MCFMKFSHLISGSRPCTLYQLVSDYEYVDDVFTMHFVSASF